jgi:hypothetical protein
MSSQDSAKSGRRYRNSKAKAVQGPIPRREKESRRVLRVLRQADIEVVRLGPTLLSTIRKSPAPLI